MNKGIDRPGGDNSGAKGGSRRSGSPSGGSCKSRNHKFPVGNLLGVSYPNETAARQILRGATHLYDKLNRVTEETSAGATHVHTYDKAGNRLNTVYGATARTIVNTYDTLNRLTSLTENSTAVTAYSYDLNGNITRKSLPNGSATLCTFDALGRRLAEVAQTSGGALISSFDYSAPVATYPSSYDNVGNLLQISENYGRADVKARTVTNTYDSAYRLIIENSAETAGATVATAYAYDNNNNRLTKIAVGGTDPGTWISSYGTTTDSYNSNQLKSVVKGSTTTTFQYDANGNRSLKLIGGVITQTYSYDFENRLIALVDSSKGTFSYTYDHRTRRVGRDESAASGDKDELSFAGGLSVQEYTNGATTPSVEYIRGSDYGGGIGGVLYTIRGADRSYNAYNSRGDVVSKTDDTEAMNGVSPRYLTFLPFPYLPGE